MKITTHRIVCRRTKADKFAKASACKGYKRTKVKVRRSKKNQWLLW